MEACITGVKLNAFTSLDDSMALVVSVEVAKQMDGGNYSGLLAIEYCSSGEFSASPFNMLPYKFSRGADPLEKKIDFVMN